MPLIIDFCICMHFSVIGSHLRQKINITAINLFARQRYCVTTKNGTLSRSVIWLGLLRGAAFGLNFSKFSFCNFVSGIFSAAFSTGISVVFAAYRFCIKLTGSDMEVIVA